MLAAAVPVLVPLQRSARGWRWSDCAAPASPRWAPMLAEDLGFPFVELSREIEKFAGCSVAEIQALYGVNAYRRYERRALEEAIQIYPEAVIATPGGLVSDPANFNLLLAHCSTRLAAGGRRKTT